MTALSTDLTITGLTKAYAGDTGPPALADIDLAVPGGTTLAVLGPSGCGKSTLLRLIAGLDVPDAGRVVLGGRDLSGPGYAVDPDRRDVNMVFQNYALWPHLRVRDIIGYGLAHGRHRTSAGRRRERVAELVTMLRLDGLEDRFPAEISGGQQQRVAIARALATEPVLLLFDEPLSNLDVQLRMMMRGELSTLLASLDTTVVYVTHDVTEALALADEILVLHAGRAVQHDTAERVFARPASPWVAEMAGFTSTLTPAAIEHRGLGTAHAQTGSGSLVGRVCALNGNGASQVRVHPDAVHVVTDEIEPSGDGVDGLVVGCYFEGRRHRIVVEIDGAGSITVMDPRPLPIGQKTRLRIDPDGVLVFEAAA